MKALVMSVLLLGGVSLQALPRLYYRVLNHRTVGFIPADVIKFDSIGFAGESRFLSIFATPHATYMGYVIAIDQDTTRELHEASMWILINKRTLFLKVTYIDSIKVQGKLFPVYRFEGLAYRKPKIEDGDYIIDDTLITPSPSDYKPIRK